MSSASVDTVPGLDRAGIRRLARAQRADNLRRAWYKFSRNYLSVVGLVLVLLITLIAIFAPWVAPYPQHASVFADFANAGRPPGAGYLFGTDMIGRDILSRTIFALRSALLMGVVVLALAAPLGVLLGLIAGYFHGTYLDAIIMRITDVFISVPPLILALAVAAVLEPNLTNAMIAVTVMWWPWYVRLVYGLGSALRNEDFVKSAELLGASKGHILFREILPNCLGPIFTKMSLDMAFVIIIGASLSFVGLGEQAPRAALGTMVADGARHLPDQWWIPTFPSLAIVVLVLGFNLLGDGLHDLFASERA